MDAAHPDTSAGLEMIDAVYGDGFRVHFQDATDPLMQDTVDHLFGRIWSRPGLSIRDRRLLTMGVLGAAGRADLFAVHATAALKTGDLDADQLQEIVLHLAYYAGAGNGTSLRRGAQDAVANFQAKEPDQS